MKALLAGVCLAAFVASPARAQLATYCVNCTAEWQEVVRHAEMVKNALNELTTLRAQLDQQIATFQAIAHIPDDALNQVAGALSVPAIRNPLPNGQALAQILSGAAVAGGALNGAINQFTTANRIYTPPYGGDFSANAMATNAASIAGAQAAAQQLYASAQQHSQALAALEGQLKGAPDTKAVADIQARLALESAYIGNQQVQATTLGAWQGAQVRLTDQQKAESRRCYIEAMLNGVGEAQQDTCSRPASQGAVQLASAGTGAGLLASGYEQYIGNSVGSGQCTALVQATSDVGLTRTWTQGEQVLGNNSLAVGTPIATFDGQGRYANATDGSSHAAIYMGQDSNGNIKVLDQWLGHNAAVRTLPTTGSNAANSGSAFYVINHS